MKLTKFWSFVMMGHIIALLVIGLGFFQELKIGQFSINYAVVFGIIYLIYTFSPTSWTQVNADETGVKLFFGQVLEKSDSGLSYAPWPFITIERFPSTTVSFDVPGVNEEVVRITFQNQTTTAPGPTGAPTAQPTGDPIARAVTCEPQLTVTFKIDQPENFIQVTPTLEKAQEQLADYAVSVLQMLGAKKTARDVLNDFPQFNTDLTSELDKLINALNNSQGFDWGIKAQVVLKDIGLPKRVNVEIAELAASVAKPERAKNEAEAARTTTVTAAEAAKRATELAAEAALAASASDLLAAENKRKIAQKQGEGRAAELKAVADALGISGEAVLMQATSVEVASKFSNVTTLVTGGSDNSGIAGAGVIAEALKTALANKGAQPPKNNP